MNRYFLLLAIAAALLVGKASAQPGTFTSGSLADDSRLFEMRTYYAATNKLEALHTRFRDHVLKLYASHKMDVIGFWVPMDQDGRFGNTIVCILAFPDRQTRNKDWKEFAEDPEWKKVKSESEKDGRLIDKVVSFDMTPTDYSPIK